MEKDKAKFMKNTMYDLNLNKARQQIYKDIVIAELPILKPSDANYYENIGFDRSDSSKKYQKEDVQKVFHPEIEHPMVQTLQDHGTEHKFMEDNEEEVSEQKSMMLSHHLGSRRSVARSGKSILKKEEEESRMDTQQDEQLRSQRTVKSSVRWREKISD